MQHRPEIDGLRAIAVIPVILFHVGLGLFSGGFIGVDVFFVISGFLITGIIHAEVNSGTFSLARFYQRRIKRILPALTVTIIGTLLAGFLLLLPEQLVTLGQSVIATALFSSNIWLSRQAGYFAALSDMMPLLHTWSLAIEEQFYIALPLLVCYFRRFPRLLVPAIAALAITSFIINLRLTSNSPNLAFYSFFGRSWELLAGSFLAVVPLISNRLTRETASFVGLCLIGFAVVTFDDTTIFPGVTALIPVIGASLVIYGGGTTVFGKVLGSRPLVWIGLISYSLYLWHWPIIVFSKQLTVSSELSPPWILISLIMTVAASVLSWRYIEQPFRHVRTQRLHLFRHAGAVLALAIAFGYLPISARGFPARYSDRALAYMNGESSPRGKVCVEQGARTLDFCTIGKGHPSFVLWGDSHAGALLPAIEIVAKVNDRSGIFAGFRACPPVFVDAPRLRGLPRLKGVDARNCMTRNQSIASRIEMDPTIKTVIVTSFWSSYEFSENDVRRVLDRLKDKRVFLLEDTPTPGFDVPWVLALKEGTSISPAPAFISPSASVPALQVASSYPNVSVVRLDAAMCYDEKCPTQRDGNVLYVDSNHISDYAAREIVGPYLERMLRPF